MASRQKTILNNNFQINVRLICDRMEALGIMTNVDLALRLGVHKNTTTKILRERRIPKPELFDKLTSELGVTREELLVPLVGVSRG